MTVTVAGWAAEGGRTFGFSEVAGTGTGDCARGAEAGMACGKTVSEDRVALRLGGCGIYH